VPVQRVQSVNACCLGCLLQFEMTEADMDWQHFESKLLTSSAYHDGKHILYLRFWSGEVYCYFEIFCGAVSGTPGGGIPGGATSSAMFGTNSARTILRNAEQGA
jgi:hypothetical protein